MKSKNQRRIGILLTAFAALLLFANVAGAVPAAKDAAKDVPPPPLPAIRALRLEPASLTLKEGRDDRRVLVFGVTEGDKVIDLTSQAVFKTGEGAIEIDAQGYIHPKAKGSAEVLVTAAGKEIKLPVTVEDAAVPPVRFVRDIQPSLPINPRS